MTSDKDFFERSSRVVSLALLCSLESQSIFLEKVVDLIWLKDGIDVSRAPLEVPTLAI